MTDAELLKKYGFKPEIVEMARDQPGNQSMLPSGFPEPVHGYRVVLQQFNQSIEELYFWVLEHIKNDQGFGMLQKITDTFSASEQSSFFGSAQQRLGFQQEKVSMFLATIGKMTKELFQLVREIRILDERLGYYKDSYDPNSKSRESAEITLKGIWVDMVEQGSKNPASIYGMAKELQFVTLPDLFYSIHPKTEKDVDEEVNKLDFNNKVKEVLKRKLRSFMEWKKSTYKELQTRRKFTIKYLRQHFDIIRMYVSWVKPYLRNIKRLQMVDNTESVDLINAFEGSLVEVEFLAKKMPATHFMQEIKYNKKVYAVVLVHFYHRTRPSMNYMQEYNRGPLHVGMINLSIKAYAWTQEEIDKYIKMKREEEFELISSIDESVKAAMEALGDDLEAYLKEAGEDIEFEKKEEEKKEKPKEESVLEPFVALFSGFRDLFGVKQSSSKEKLNSAELSDEIAVASVSAREACWQTYKNFKKKEGMLAW